MARPRQISDDQILTTMRACVFEHGPAVPLDLVAAKLHVTPPALLKRFGNRQRLMLAALKPPDDKPWYAALAEGPDDRPLNLQLEELIRRTTAITDEVMPCVAALRESGIPSSEIYPRGTPPLVKGVQALTAWLERAQARGLVGEYGLEPAANALLGAISTRAISAHLLKRPWSPREQAAYALELSQLFTRALAPAARTPRTSRSRPS